MYCRQPPTGGADFDLCADMRVRRATLIAGGHFGPVGFILRMFSFRVRC